MRWTKVAGVLQFGAHLDWSVSKVSLFEVLESSSFWWKKVFNWTRRRNFSKPRLIENSSVFLTLSNLQRNHSLIQHSLHCDWKTAENRGGELGSLVKYYYYYYYYHYYFFFYWLLLSADTNGYSRLRRSCKPTNVPKSRKAVLPALDKKWVSLTKKLSPLI